MMADSEMGVSRMRSAPKRSIIPALTWKAPPRLPTSSPISTTLSSRSISPPIASANASVKVRRGAPSAGGPGSGTGSCGVNT